MADDPPPDESTVQAAIALAWLSNSAPPSPAGPRHAYGIPLCAGSAADQDLSTEKAPFSAPLRLRMRSAFEASSDEDPEQGERGLSDDDDDDDDQDPDGHDEEQHQAGTTPGTTTARTWPRPHTARGLPTHPAHGRRTQLVIIPWPRHDRGTGCMHAKKDLVIHFFLYSFSVPVPGVTLSRAVLLCPRCPWFRHRPWPHQVVKHIKVAHSRSPWLHFVHVAMPPPAGGATYP